VEFGQSISHVPVSIAQLVFAKMGTMLDYAGVGWDPIRDSDGNFATGIMSALQLSKGTYGDPTSEWYMPAGLFLAERGLIHLIVKVDDLLEVAVHVAPEHVKTFLPMNVDMLVWDALLPELSTEPSAVFRFPGAGQPNLEGHLKSLALAKQRNGTYVEVGDYRRLRGSWATTCRSTRRFVTASAVRSRGGRLRGPWRPSATRGMGAERVEVGDSRRLRGSWATTCRGTRRFVTVSAVRSRGGRLRGLWRPSATRGRGRGAERVEVGDSRRLRGSWATTCGNKRRIVTVSAVRSRGGRLRGLWRPSATRDMGTAREWLRCRRRSISGGVACDDSWRRA